VTALLVKRIAEGAYPEESRLPSEVALQEETGHARETIRQAIAELRRRGIIETVAGKGSFVVPESERSPQPEPE
jgi:DNA-binding GntR family transcriptional regulator